MNLLIQFPTYTRPQKFINALKRYLFFSSGCHQLHFNINCDSGDATMANDEMRQEIDGVFSEHNTRRIEQQSYSLNYDQNTSKISSMNAHIDGKDFDIVVCASDDMIPKVKSWDDIICQEMVKHFPDLSGCVHFNDGNTGDSLITLSILGRELYNHFGYIYHPDYKTLYCDNEFTECVKSMGKWAYVDKEIISHEHWSVSGSENHNQIDIAVQKTLHYSGRDATVYRIRKIKGFPKGRITDD